MQVAPDPRLTYPEANRSRITNDTPGRQLLCSDPAALPEGWAG